MPAFRQTSATDFPSSACRNTNAICCSLEPRLLHQTVSPPARRARLEFSSLPRSDFLGAGHDVQGLIGAARYERTVAPLTASHLSRARAELHRTKPPAPTRADRRFSTTSEALTPLLPQMSRAYRHIRLRRDATSRSAALPSHNS